MSKAKEFIESSKTDKLRGSMQGYVGSDFAKKADDADLEKMADLKDELAKIHNSKVKPIVDQMSSLRKKYKLKPLKQGTY